MIQYIIVSYTIPGLFSLYQSYLTSDFGNTEASLTGTAAQSITNLHSAQLSQTHFVLHPRYYYYGSTSVMEGEDTREN